MQGTKLKRVGEVAFEKGVDVASSDIIRLDCAVSNSAGERDVNERLGGAAVEDNVEKQVIGEDLVYEFVDVLRDGEGRKTGN